MRTRHRPPVWPAGWSFFMHRRYARAIGLIVPLLVFSFALPAPAAALTALPVCSPQQVALSLSAGGATGIILPAGQPDRLLNATFQLTLLGPETSGQSFGLELVPRGLQIGQTGFDLCGAVQPCVGSGHVYERRFAFPAGTVLDYKFEHQSPGGGFQVLASGMETLNRDMTITAGFRFEASGNNDAGANQPVPSVLPNTGTGTTLPLGSPREAYVALSTAALMFLGGFALRRRASSGAAK